MTLNIHELLSPIFKTLNIDEIILKGKDFEQNKSLIGIVLVVAGKDM